MSSEFKTCSTASSMAGDAVSARDPSIMFTAWIEQKASTCSSMYTPLNGSMKLRAL